MAPPLQSLRRACGGCQQAVLQELLALLLCPEGLLGSGRQGQGVFAQRVYNYVSGHCDGAGQK